MPKRNILGAITFDSLSAQLASNNKPKEKAIYDLIKQNKLKPLGKGTYGTVIATPASAIKISQIPISHPVIKNEINANAVAGELGIGPRIHNTSVSPIDDKVGYSIIEMDKLNPAEYTPAYKYFNSKSKDFLDKYMLDLDSTIDQQKAVLALNGFSIGDGHAGNYMIHKETGEPIRIDYDSSHPIVSRRNRLHQASNIIGHRFRKNGQEDEGNIFQGLVEELIEKKDLAGAAGVIQDGLDMLAQYPPSSIGKVPQILPNQYNKPPADYGMMEFFGVQSEIPQSLRGQTFNIDQYPLG